MFAPDLLNRAETFLERCRTQHLTVVTAESCTGGLLAGLLTTVPGASDVIERGFITYSDDAKIDVLSVGRDAIDHHGAVSAHVARDMASGALQHSRSEIAAAITGIAGPGGGSEHKPVGLVYIAVKRRGSEAIVKSCTFGDVGRARVRLEAVDTALDMLDGLVRGETG